VAGNGVPAIPDAGSNAAALDAAPEGGSPDADAASSDAGADATGVAPPSSAAGTSCGVGLPALCALQTHKCCARSLRTDTCIEAAASCTCDLPDCSVMEAFCDGPEDCEQGQVCCGTLVGGSRYERFACAASCDFGGTQRIACHEDQAECPAGTECANSQLLTNVQVCIDPATIRQ
jgi:hypothetical protein